MSEEKATQSIAELGKETQFRSGAEAVENGRKGGQKSGEVRRAKRDARQAAQKLLDMAVTGKFKENLLGLGYSEDDVDGMKNIDYIVARLFTSASSGNLPATEKLLKIAGYDSEENRLERESINADRRRELELDAKIAALTNGNAGGMALNMGDEDGNNDVVIYMPEVMTEEACEMPPETDADVAE